MSDNYKESLHNIVQRIIKYEQILVVGSEVIREEGNHQTTVNNFLFQRFNEEERGSDEDRYIEYPKIIRENSKEFAASKLNPQLRQLLETECFRLVLTTTFDPILENALREIWQKRGLELRVCNIWESGLKGDITIGETSTRFTAASMQPTLFYVFGNAKVSATNSDGQKKFILDDNDRIEVVTRWIKNPPQNLVNFIRSRRILALGCKLNDWLFRFFWVSLIGDVKKLRLNGEVAVTLDDNDQEEKRLHNYLEKKIRLFVAPDAKKFLYDLNACFNDKQVRDARVKEQRKNGGLFISYRSESVVDAFRLFTRLTDDGYNVWLDTERLEEGVEYENKIFEAMDLSRAIITLIDANMLKAFETNPEEEHKRFYYEKEWLHAQQLKENHGNKYAILPITLHGCKKDSRIELLPSFLKKSHMCDADTEYKAICNVIDELPTR